MKANHQHIWGADRVALLLLSGERIYNDDIYCIECKAKPNMKVRAKLRLLQNYPTDARYFIVDRVEKMRYYGRNVNLTKFTAAEQRRLAISEKGNK